MKAQEFKDFFNSLTEDQLKQEVTYDSKEFSVSGTPRTIEVAEENLYSPNDEHPSALYTEEELLERGYGEEEIEDFIIIAEGDIVINL